MNLKKLFSALCLMLVVLGAFAQRPGSMLEITDSNNVTTVIENATTSSSSSCNSSDFPVYRDGNRTDINFRDLTRIIVRPDRPSKNDALYVTVELVDRSGKTEVTELIRSIRFMGDAEDGKFRARVEDIRSVEVIL